MDDKIYIKGIWQYLTKRLLFVGKGAGSLIGGYLMKFFGTRPTYQMFAGATFITGCIYYLFNKFYLRKRATSDNDICEKKPVTDIVNRQTPSDKHNSSIDVAAGKMEATRLNNLSTELILVTNQSEKIVSDNIDGGSDSGVDNPAFIETESANGGKKDSDIK